MNLKEQLATLSHLCFQEKIIKKIKHKKIDKIICTNLVNTNECIFIFVVFKNDIDCMMIDNPLNEIMPEQSAIEIFDAD